MSEQIEIVALSRGARDIMRFLKVSYAIYVRDPYWVTPLLMNLKKVFRDKNPLFEHAEMQALWVATRTGRMWDASRASSTANIRATDQQRRSWLLRVGGRPGDQPAAVSRAVTNWARRKGMKKLIRPMNPTTNDECGLLVDGFDSMPVFMMTYNPRYYVGLVEPEGFRKAKDLLAFHMDLAK